MPRSRAVLLALLFLGTVAAGCLQAEDGPQDPLVPPPPPAPTDRTPAWGDPATATLRPGAQLATYCTFNWIFTDRDGNAYIGTAAHCTDLGERMEHDGEEIGTVVFDSDETAGAPVELDFSLILLDGAAIANAHPRMLGQDGPTGVAEAPAVGDLVAIHGYGMLLGENDLTRDRIGVLMEVTETEYRANMPAVWGDSGAPILHVATGTALGIVSRFGAELPLPTTDVGPRVTWILDALHASGWDVELATT